MHKRLHAKGWSVEEMAQTDVALHKAQKRKHPYVHAVEKSMFWFILVLGVLGSIILSVALIPVLVASNGQLGYWVTGVFGLLLGSLIIHFAKPMPWISRDHLIMTVIVPVCAIFSFFIVSVSVNDLNSFAGLPGRVDALFLGLSYFVGFLLPYALYLAFRGWK